MNAMTHQFVDAKGKIDFAAWRAHDAKLAASFGDRVDDFIAGDILTRDQIGRAFLTPQLHRIESEVYMRKYPSFDFASLMTVNTDGDMWDVGTVFYSMEPRFLSSFTIMNILQFAAPVGIISLGVSRKVTPQLASLAMVSGSNTIDHDSTVKSAPSTSLILATL